MIKHYIFLGIFLLAGLMAIGMGSGAVLANNTGVEQQDDYKVKEIKGVSNEEKVKEERVKLENGKIGFSINPSGIMQFSGAKFVSLSGQNVMINVYGLPLTLVSASSTQVIGVASLANMVAGDVLSGKGMIDPNSGVITASMIRDESQQSNRIVELERQIKSLLEQLNRLQLEFKGLR